MGLRDPEAARVYRKRYYAKHKKRLLAAQAAARRANPALFRRYQQSADAKRKDRIDPRVTTPGPKREAYLARTRAYNKSERGQRRKQTYALANKENILASGRAWSARNKEQVALKAARRRARARSVLRTLTLAQWREIKDAYGHRCVYCRRKMKHLTMDHIIPLIKGGAHTAQNVVPACRSCNSRKRDGGPLVPVQPLLLTVA